MLATPDLVVNAVRGIRRRPLTHVPTAAAIAVPRMFDAEHTLAVERADTGTTFIHAEHSRGVLPPVMDRLLAATHDAFVAMDTAMARRAEALATRDVT